MKGKLQAAALLYLAVCILTCNCTGPSSDYHDPSLPSEKRAEILLGKMTLHEKCLQLQNRYIGSVSDIAQVFEGESVGTVHNMSGDAHMCRDLMDSVQRYMLTATRLAIPVLPCVEGIQGILQDGCTLYPCALAQGSTFNPDLVREATSQMAAEARAMGLHQILSPVLDIARDLRWGRVEETFGEDPFLIGKMGTAFIEGYQGEGDMTCTPKHFVAHGSPTGGLNCASVPGGQRELRSLYLYPFRKVISETSPLSVMSCYSSYDGVAVTGSRYYMTDILRGELGFDGYVYSDWGSVERLYNFHHSVLSPADAAAKALMAGVDINIDSTSQTIEEQVLDGTLDEKYVDEAVLRILTVKFKLGLFDDPFSKEGPVRDGRSVALSEKVAQESAVLLENNGILPLDFSTVRSICVVGPNASQTVYGDYSWTTSDTREGISLLQGLSQVLPPSVALSYEKGCDHWSQDASGIDAAVRKASQSDVIIAAVGTRSTYLARNPVYSTSGEGFDLSSLDLPGMQQELLERLAITGKPLIVVLISGKPLAIPWVKDHADALLVQWYGGEMQGKVLAQILAGEVNPSGRLNVSFPRSTGATPCYYNYLPTDKDYMGNTGGTLDEPNDRYIFESCYSLWPFGYGKSYSTFEWSDFECSAMDDGIHVSMSVSNRSDRDGKETVQVYVHDKVSSVALPCKQLKAFQKKEVRAGETKRFGMVIPYSELTLFDEEGKEVLEKGEFEIMAGPSSEEILFTGTLTL